ncbi:MAG: hypothetical protein HYV19_11690 [Gemmatimonadetes bacterium]|nr:hypothetical protein [Gemmatimonadota bacterium]
MRLPLPNPYARAVLTLISAIAALTGPARAQETDTSAWTRISYISGATIYLEVGRQQGLTEGSTLDVVRAGATVARVRVTALASTRAACELLPPVVDLIVGDSVRYVARVIPAAATAPSASASARPTRRSGLRGRIGVRYLVIAPEGGVGGLTQPAYDLRLEGSPMVGTPLGVTVDARAQRTRYTTTGAAAPRPALNSTRVYQAALSWSHAASGIRVAAGRQLAGALTSVGLFDGLSVDLGRRQWATGLFVGSQPDAVDFGLSSQIREYGAYGEWHTAPGVRTMASVTMGGVGSYVGTTIDREYGFTRVTLTSPLVSLYATQELDVNRGWRRAAERVPITATASFASVQVTPTPRFILSGGIDHRRNARLYRDYVDPEQSFDDAFREGSWAGLTFVAPRYARLSVDRRDSRGGGAGNASSNTVMASASGLTRWRVGLRTRVTAFDGALASGQLASGAVEIDPWGVVRIEGNGGVRTTRATGSVGAANVSWWGVDADITIRRSLYLMLSTYREREAGASSMQTYAALSWRF